MTFGLVSADHHRACDTCLIPFSAFLLLAMLGGALWCLGNMTVVPIVKMIGLSMGLLVWCVPFFPKPLSFASCALHLFLSGSFYLPTLISCLLVLFSPGNIVIDCRGVSNLLTGWFCGHFGIFVSKEIPPHPVLNYLGLVSAILSVALYLPVKSETKTPAQEEKHDLPINSSQYDRLESVIHSHSDTETHDAQNHHSRGSQDEHVALDLRGVTSASVESPSSPVPPKSAEPFFSKEKLFGFGLSIVAGVLYGSNMIPVKYLQDRDPAANPLEFALSHYIGIWLTSTAFMVGYAIYKKNNPFVNPRSLLAAMTAGTGWGMAQAGGFIANANLGLTTSFPIICTGPGVIGALWGIFAFKEIRGLRNYLWLGGAFALTFLGIILITLSKVPNL